MKKLDRNQMAARVARDIPEGSYVNLGIGLPTLVADHLPKGREIILHSENGVLGIGPKPPAGEEDEDLINAGKEPVTLLAGGAYFHHADSFGMIRGMHLDWAKKVLVMMEHLTKKGESKIVERCSYPLTGARCVNRIYTDLAVIDVKPDGLHVVDMVDGLSFEELQRLSGVPLRRLATAA
ncbi:MAG: 3-oxoadipate CoA-transferase [Betaproteobacteria bacterium]|nr:MAG: 3-oxoadipate CoA-transferase [Betaproteobacteria bacterium]